MYSKLYNESWKYGKVKILKAALSGNDKKGQRSDSQILFYRLPSLSNLREKVVIQSSKMRLKFFLRIAQFQCLPVWSVAHVEQFS